MTPAQDLVAAGNAGTPTEPVGRPSAFRLPPCRGCGRTFGGNYLRRQLHRCDPAQVSRVTNERPTRLEQRQAMEVIARLGVKVVVNRGG